MAGKSSNGPSAGGVGGGGVHSNAIAVTQHDSNIDPNGPFSALWVGTSGNVKLTTKAGQTVTLSSVQGYVPYEVRNVWSNGTTASNILGFDGKSSLGLKIADAVPLP